MFGEAKVSGFGHVSELMRESPALAAKACVRDQPVGALCSSAADEAKPYYGAACHADAATVNKPFSDIGSTLRGRLRESKIVLVFGRPVRVSG